MSVTRLRERFRRFVEAESLRPDLARATRATVAFMIPLTLAATVGLPVEPTFAAIAAQNLAMVDVRGAYRIRFGLLLAMLLVLAGGVALGGLAAGNIAGAIAATAFLALSGGLWRHVSADYGPGLAISSALLFFISLASPPSHESAHLTATLAGGALGLLIQMVFWPIRPQHPLRRTVAETWVAVAQLFEAMEPAAPARDATGRYAEAEAGLRSALNHTDRALENGNAAAPLRASLAELNLFAARLAVRIGAIHTTLESPSHRRLAPALLPLFDTLANTSRAIALAVVSRQPAHVALCEVRFRRLSGLLDAVEARASAQGREDADIARLPDLLSQIRNLLGPLADTLRAAVGRAHERAAFPMELLELKTWQLRSLASAIDLSPRLDASLVRFSLRLAVLASAAVCAFMLLKLPHGYWLPFTIVVVLQPDYGSTRARAAQRVLGTLAGSLVAGALLWLHPPAELRLPLIAACVFFFCYNVRRRYALAMFCVTIFVMLLMEAAGGTTVAVAAERVATTLAGGLLALGAALIFWPAWERDRLPPLLAAALRGNREYLRLLAESLATGGGVDKASVAAKRAVESANALVFSSLRRLFADPQNRRESVERIAALANGNQRVTRLANVILVQLRAGEPAAAPVSAAMREAVHSLGAALEALASTLETDNAADRTRLLAPHALALDTLEPPRDAGQPEWMASSLARAATEVRGMVAAAA